MWTSVSWPSLPFELAVVDQMGEPAAESAVERLARGLEPRRVGDRKREDVCLDVLRGPFDDGDLHGGGAS